MRFLSNGPLIPDELLWARDQGRVVFFCGAGVSRAYADLPDFFGLAEAVIEALGVEPEGPARKLFQAAREIDDRVGVSGVISADRIFGLLERDFSSRDINGAVASALRPPKECNLTAHEVLLDLSTAPSGKIQLITTNFDRLFDDCQPGSPIWRPPRLPDPRRSNDLDGVVYLHGQANAEYTGAEGDGFILSSSEFGRAYLSDGWATAFIREILQEYIVVFVGYAADDPPVQYLLEALRNTPRKRADVYAFQSGEYSEAVARWKHKGVEAIPYDASEKHAALWLSLKAWASRARDPAGWYEDVLKLARRGPAVLDPYQRGQVAHVVSNNDGVKKFAEADEPPPAEWLCVFDPRRRYAMPARVGSIFDKGLHVDPFDKYGLDSDLPPPSVRPDDHYTKREVPNSAWDAFALSKSDLATTHDEHFASFRANATYLPPKLVPRLNRLAVWIARVCDQPASVWWATYQGPLHPSIQWVLSSELKRKSGEVLGSVERAWDFLLETWRSPRADHNTECYVFAADAKNKGWSAATVRQFREVFRPYYTASSAFNGNPIPPSTEPDLPIEDLLRRDVQYPDLNQELHVSDDFCAAVCEAMRQNLREAFELEKDIGGYGLQDICPIEYDENRGDVSFDRIHGLSAAVLRFCKVFSQLIRVSRCAAKNEFLSWPSDDESIFARLRIWAAGKSEIVSNREFASVIKSLSNATFWFSRHQRDLLIVLSRRLPHLDSAARTAVERRLFQGPKRWDGESRDNFKARKALAVLDRISWLERQGYEFSLDIKALIEPLRSLVPEWEPAHGARAADSMESRGGWVKTNTDFECLLDQPLRSILKTAKELAGRRTDFLVEKDPFSGLVSAQPVRAFSALSLAARHGDVPDWAWRRFLEPEKRKDDKARFALHIAERLASYPDEQLSIIVRSVADWLSATCELLASRRVESFDRVTERLISVLKRHPSLGQSGFVRGGKDPDWAMEAINSPAGKVAEAISNDPRFLRHQVGQPLSPIWVTHAEAMLQLSDDFRRYTLVILFRNLEWLYHIDPAWTDKNLLCALDSINAYDRNAAWSGFFWGSKVPSKQLFLRLKESLLSLSVTPLPSRHSYTEIVNGIILAGWGSTDEQTGDRFISDSELRAWLLRGVDEVRSRILWQFERWISADDSKSADYWLSQLPAFLRVWPRQMSARSARVSAAFCRLVFSTEDKFPEAADLILPFLVKVEKGEHLLYSLIAHKNCALDRYPTQVLAVLYAVLPERADAWPYATETILQRTADADRTLTSDPRYVELKRRWDAR